jgi:Fur family transcriptional regulator, zinc uptake regulator
MQDKTAKAMQMAEKICMEGGHILTAPRRRVLACLLGTTQPLKAYDIVENLGDAKPMTVYRALEFLSGAGLVHRIESLNAYAPCVEEHCRHTDSQYLVCDFCGKVEELHDHSIDHFIAEKISKSGFALAYKTLELHGRCASCQS